MTALCAEQDCGHPSYVGNYISFYFAIKAHYPRMQLIANCNMGADAPTEMWDWYVAVTGSLSSFTMCRCSDEFI